MAGRLGRELLDLAAHYLLVLWVSPKREDKERMEAWREGRCRITSVDDFGHLEFTEQRSQR